MRPEILAPAGGFEQLTAAVRCGADAVYLGAGGFNARRNAQNFGDGKLSEAVRYAHVRGVKVHLTVNTLVMDPELPALDGAVREAAESGVDAVIIQDLAVNARFRDLCPDLPRHASTQMTVHNLDGARLAADLGFSRVVLARELTLREIEHITARCGIETEVFIHGALCMCMSGQCTLSSMLGGRSGNRGFCAQPCRLDFHNAERGYALSLKDMSHLKYLKELADIGVASFKIEGRMKRPEYVAAAVTAARAALDGEAYDEDTLRAVFSRSGFTDGYLTGKRDASMFGVRDREDVAAAGEVLGRLAGLYRKERQNVPVELSLIISHSRTTLRAVSGNVSTTVEGPSAEPARTLQTTPEIARKSLIKTGGTSYFVNSFSADIEPGLMVPASALNALRREALEKLTELRGAPSPWKLPEVAPALPEPRREAPERPEIWGRFEKSAQICGNFDRIILPLSEVEKSPQVVEKYGDKLTVELPSLFFDTEDDKIVEKLRKLGIKDVLCETLYAVNIARRAGITSRGGAGLNVMNSLALSELRRLGLVSATVSFELNAGKIAALGGQMPRGIVAYGRLPLMRFRACPVRGKRGCGSCTGVSKLIDRRGTGFPVLCHQKQYGTLLNSVPLHIADKIPKNLDFLTLYFTLETPEEAEAVLEQYRNHIPSAGPRTGGLYFRQIL